MCDRMIRRDAARTIRDALHGLAAVLFAVAGAVSASASAVAAQDSKVTGVRIGVDPDSKKLPKGTTRVVLDVSDKTPYSAFLLGDPYRLVIDLPEMEWSVDDDKAPSPKGVVDKLRYGLFRPGNSRVVVDLKSPVRIAAHAELKRPARLMFDLVPVPPARFKSGEVVSAANWRPPAAGPTAAPAGKKRSGDGRRVVVIDAGHGGVDPGAVRRRTYEKTITLDIAKEVKRKLEATGRYRVVLTRQRDIFLELRDRVKVAHEQDGDIFISLHADTHPKSVTRGASVYTLSETASDKEAAALAAKENRVDVIAGVNLSGYSDEVAGFLLSLRQRQTMNQSAVFANMAIRHLDKKKIRIVSKKHRFAGFAVLKSPDVPSILIELGYLSNKYDRKLLLKKDFRRRTASAILGSLDEYFKRLAKLDKQ